MDRVPLRSDGISAVEPEDPLGSVAEVALAGEDHGEAVLVNGSNNQEVSDEPKRLDDSGSGRFDGAVETVGAVLDVIPHALRLMTNESTQH